MKKFLSAFLCLVTAVTMTACGGNANSSTTAEVALVTDHGSIDDKAFNQGAWEGIVAFAKDNDKSYQYFRPVDKSTDAYMNSIQMAVKSGAKIIVCPGFLFEAAIYQAQDMYPDVKFVILDGTPQDGTYTDFKTAENTYSIIYAEEQSGFLAGYAAVKEGFRKLGFMGGVAVPPVVRFGYGFAQGADFAASELGLAKNEIEIKYNYTGSFEATPEIQTKAASWYKTGTEVIFSCGALIVNNITAAAEAEGSNKFVVGVDVDQSSESKTVITSAMKKLGSTVYTSLEEFYKGEFKGGVNAVLGAEDDAVGLPDDFSRFKNFTQEDYKTVYEKVKSNENNMTKEMFKDTENGKTITFADASSRMSFVKLIEVA